MRAPAPTFSTDRQRLARAGRPQPTAPAGDKARLARPAVRQAPTPLTVKHDTWVIRGQGGTYLGLAFGDGRTAHQLNLYDYIPARYVPRLSNLIIDLTGILPDAFGLDIGLSGGLDLYTPLFSTNFSGLGGINLIWHSRGDVRANFPEVHVYYGYSGTASKGSTSPLTAVGSIDGMPTAAGAVQLILAWARTYSKEGVGQPASNQWIANGYNWTGTFWSTGISIPAYEAFSLVGSYYQSIPFFSDPSGQSVWRGISLGVGVSGKVQIKTPFKHKFTIKPDVADVLRRFDWKRLKSMGISSSKTEYGLLFGNGGDFIPAAAERGLPDRSITGWHWGQFPGINQNNDK